MNHLRWLFKYKAIELPVCNLNGMELDQQDAAKTQYIKELLASVNAAWLKQAETKGIQPRIKRCKVSFAR